MPHPVHVAQPRRLCRLVAHAAQRSAWVKVVCISAVNRSRTLATWLETLANNRHTAPASPSVARHAGPNVIARAVPDTSGPITPAAFRLRASTASSLALSATRK